MSNTVSNLPPIPIDPLAGLRDYHLPPPVSWWPPAPGWWLLAALLLGLSLSTLLWWIYKRRRQAAAIRAQAELLALRAELAAHGDTGQFIRELSKLLRRFAITRFPQQQVAGLTGMTWLKFLDAHGGRGRFRSIAGPSLLDAPYQVALPPNSEGGSNYPTELANLIEDWIKHHKEPHV